ncbi:MAG: phosphoribosyltransferase domain-containing protein [Oscillospiraceae bacterium]|nr:phosphoribosyltransferase domain-containing protein [Oscillospiraceae bacterium]
MLICDNKSGYSPERLFALASRENNKKRGGLIVNFLQAKHVPAAPADTLALFDRLAEIVADGISEKKVMVIGFAETATAIGAELAARLSDKCDCTYIHTTREKFPEEMRLALFNEEHSHAVEQCLFSDKGLSLFDGIERIIFAEDELTTGKTILNFINALKNTVNCKFSAASIINGMSGENISVYDEIGADLFRLVKTDSSAKVLEQAMEVIPEEDGYFDIDSIPEELTMRMSAEYDPRLGIDGGEYEKYCESFVRQEFERMKPYLTGSTVDVIGTEECMYPAIKLAEYLNSKGYKALCHATTRSPIVPSRAEGYPLFSRYRVRSVYDDERRTFIYNLYECDHRIKVIG